MKFFRLGLGGHASITLLLGIILTAPLMAFLGDSPAAPTAKITVMTRNLYVGASFRILLGASTPDDIRDRVAQVYARILSSKFASRAEAIANEIAEARPDVVGLQEAILLLVKPPGEPSIANQPEPPAVAIDYLQILLDALQRRRAGYAIAAIVNNTDLTESTRNGERIRLIDRDVILVRTDLPPGEMRVLNTQAKNFDTKATLELMGNEVTLLRSWCSVDLMVRGKLVRVVNTHLEEEFFDLVQTFQADELLAGPFRTDLPVIVLGDFNASDGSDTYRYFLKSGVKDTWVLAHPGDPGFSCCQGEDLLNSTSQLKERIDFILYRGSQINVDEIKLVGSHPSDRTPSGHWPSDHAGVVAKLSIK